MSRESEAIPPRLRLCMLQKSVVQTRWLSPYIGISSSFDPKHRAMLSRGRAGLSAISRSNQEGAPPNEQMRRKRYGSELKEGHHIRINSLLWIRITHLLIRVLGPGERRAYTQIK